MTMIKPFSLTHVVYDADDSLGPLWALLSLAPPFCVVSLTTIVVVSRDLRAAFVLLGVCATSAVSTALKLVLKHPRPNHRISSDDEQHGADADASHHRHGHHHLPSSQEGGMPSNHAAFVTFAAIFSILFAIRRCGNMQGPTPLVKWTKRWLPPSVATTIALGCSYSRVHLGYHTPAQVGGGAIVGLVMGLTFFALYEGRWYRDVWASTLEVWLHDWDFCSPHEVGDLAAERRKALDARRKLDAHGWKKN